MGGLGRIGRPNAILALALAGLLALAVAPGHWAVPEGADAPGPAAVACDFLGQYFNHDENHPDMEGPITGDVLGLVEDTLPIRLTPFGETQIHQFDWWDPSYFIFERVDGDLRVGYGFFPVDAGLPGDPFHFAVHWQTTVVAPATGSYDYRFGSDDDSWLFVDGLLVHDQGGVHPLRIDDASVDLSAGAHTIDIYFAERHTDESAIYFEFTTEVECFPEGEPPCPHSQGFWKNHATDWPVDELLLGSESYDQAALLALLRTPTRGDASLILARQLIAAKLNVENGSQSSAVEYMIADADAAYAALPGRLPFAVRPSSPEGQTMATLAETLDMYNNGLLTGGCR